MGERFRECPECPELVVIPAGSFIMGSEKGSSRERPAKKVTIPRRLASEAEWEYAARAGTTTKYWWGDKFFKGRVNCQRCGTKWSGKKSAPVGTFAANPWGLYETAGNIFEYVSDCWHKTHEATPTDGSPYVDAKCASRILKGGAWYYKSRLARPAARARNDVRISGYFIGFRVIRELP